MKTYQGSCHCGAVRFEVAAELGNTITCNCSHCSRKGFILTFVGADAFRLLAGEDALVSYRFNKKRIDHLFCRVCGTEAFARGIAEPTVAVNVRCLEGVDVEALSPVPYNGKEL